MSSSDTPIQYGHVKSSYFWDDGSGINGDTGAPASGEPMQKGLFASPSWPLGTEGYVEYNGQRADFFIGDRGPGDPAEGCNVLLDLDGQTFAELTGQSWDDTSLTVSGGEGHIDLEYYITKWGDGPGTPGAPQPMSGSQECTDAVSPLPEDTSADEQTAADTQAADAQAEEEQAAAEEKSAEESQQAEDEAAEAEEEQAAEDSEQEDDEATAAAAPQGDDGSQTGVEAETAANDLSGLSLAGAELPIAAGALTLAVLPALAVALFFAKVRPALDYAKGSDEDGRHRAASVFTAEGIRRVAGSVRERVTRLRDEYMR
ncbi:hypothetical protein ACFOVU_07200 [Nocardiopsis sediminis]|uniref:Uncharacterized protein n=1 Tax=Nocardiopsis sediminis TaxID=1778267 RepID=A0ABV8FHW8_9ACTN